MEISVEDGPFLFCFYLGEQNDTAIALGYGALFNHSYTPNIKFDNNEENLSIDFYAIDDIQSSEELTINYNGEPEDQSEL